MKTRLLILLLCLSSLSVMGQGVNSRNKPKQQPAAQKSKPVAKKTNPGNGASSRSGKQTPVKPATATTGTVNGHEWVDLGLPSGTKWATTNVGASSPSDYGNYYAWGETSTKSRYNRDNLKYRQDDKYSKFSKYVTDSKWGTVDNKTELDPSDDAAYVNWGSGWRMPSLDQMEELKGNCKWTWTTMSGHEGYKVVGPNGSSLFLPAAGDRIDNLICNVGSYGSYWSRSLYLDFQFYAYRLGFGGGLVDASNGGREDGRSVRAVLAH